MMARHVLLVVAPRHHRGTRPSGLSGRDGQAIPTTGRGSALGPPAPDFARDLRPTLGGRRGSALIPGPGSGFPGLPAHRAARPGPGLGAGGAARGVVRRDPRRPGAGRLYPVPLLLLGPELLLGPGPVPLRVALGPALPLPDD